MKKSIIVILVSFLFGVGNLYAQHNSPPESEGIEFFEGSWEEILALAKKENKPIFLDVYASWCGPCKLLKKNTFPDEKVGAYFNENFINATLNGEKGDGLKVARELKVNGYPSLYVLNSEGKLILYSVGYLAPSDLIMFGKAGMDKLN